MSLYILNSPILTDWGMYSFKKISPEEAKQLLQKVFISAVGHQATAEVISQVVGVEIPTQRIQIRMEKGDKAVIFRLLTRLPEGRVLSEEELNKLPFELGLLEKLE